MKKRGGMQGTFNARRHAPRTRNGFTIVELVVVIAVIGVLASIIYVSYASITKNVREENAKTAAQAAGAAVGKYKADHAVYPDQAAFNGLDFNKNGATFQYAMNAGAGTYCITATKDATSAYVQSGTTTPTLGACSGHNANGGDIVSNLIPDPNVTSMSGWGAGTMALGTTSPHGGTTYIRRTMTASTAEAGLYYCPPAGNPTFTAGAPYSSLAWVRINHSISMRLSLVFKDSANVALLTQYGPTITVPANTWTKITVDNVVAPTGSARVCLRTYSVAGQVWSAGDLLDVDTVMLVKSSRVYEYADGSTPFWSWNGTPNASASTGPEVRS